MKKLLLITILILSSIVTLSGCLEHVELNKLGIVSGLAIDKNGDRYLVTAQILNPPAIAGETQNALPIYTLKAEGASIHEAYKKLDQYSSSALFLSHLNVIVINEEFAKDGFSPILNFALRYAEIRPDISIIVAKDHAAEDILNVVTAVDMIPAARLNISALIPTRTARLTSSNLYEVVDMVNTHSTNVVLNAVSIHLEEAHIDDDIEQRNEDEDKVTSNGSTIDNILNIANPVQLRIEHLAVFQGDKLVGFIDDYEAQFYNIIMGQHKRYTIVTRVEEDYYISAGIVSQLESNITTDLANNEATIKINLKAIIAENTYPLDLTYTENLTAMGDYLQKQVEDDMNKFINKIQTELKSDIFGIGGKAYYQEYDIWQEKKGYWSELFPELKINLEIELHVDSIGEIGNVTL